MTAEEMVIEVYEQLGEPTNLDIYESNGTTFNVDDVGTVRILRWLNEAQNYIGTFKFPNGTRLRFKNLLKRYNVSIAAATGTAKATGSTTTSLVVTAAEADWTNKLVRITSTGEESLIVDSSYATGDNTYSLRTALTAPPHGLSFSVFSQEIDVPEKVLGVLQVVELDGLSELSPAAVDDMLMTDQVGTPGSWKRIGGKVRFDVFAESTMWFQLLCLCYPTTIVATTAEASIELPVAVHPIMVDFAVWQGLKGKGETERAYALKKDIDDQLMRIRTEQDAETESPGKVMTVKVS